MASNPNNKYPNQINGAFSYQSSSSFPTLQKAKNSSQELGGYFMTSKDKGYEFQQPQGNYYQNNMNQYYVSNSNKNNQFFDFASMKPMTQPQSMPYYPNLNQPYASNQSPYPFQKIPFHPQFPSYGTQNFYQNPNQSFYSQQNPQWSYPYFPMQNEQAYSTSQKVFPMEKTKKSKKLENSKKPLKEGKKKVILEEMKDKDNFFKKEHIDFEEDITQEMEKMNISSSSTNSNFQFAHLFDKDDESVVLSEGCDIPVFPHKTEKSEEKNENELKPNNDINEKPLEKDKRAYYCCEDIGALSVKFQDKFKDSKISFSKDEEIEIINRVFSHAVPLMKRTNSIAIFRKIGSLLPENSLLFIEGFIKCCNLVAYCKNENYNICIQLLISIAARESFQEALIERFKPYIEVLCYHPIGVYVVQRLYQLLQGESKKKITLYIETNFDSLVYDHRAIGVIFPYITDIIRSNKMKSIKFIKKKIEPAALSIVSSKFGSLIVIKLFSVFNKTTCQAIVDYLISKMTQHIEKKHFMKLIHMILWSKYSIYRVSTYLMLF